MSKVKIKEGTTSKLARIFVQDSSSTIGAGLAGLVYNSASLTGYWIAEGDATATQITMATMTAGTWASGGFDEVDATNLPGVYEVGLPNVVVDATSEGSVLVMFKGATNMAPVLLELELDAIDYRAGVVPTVTTNTDVRGTDSAATASALATAQTDLDTLTGSDGATLATTQGNYAPAKTTDILTTALTEAYAADGAAPTLSEILFLISQHLSESSISSTTKTVKKLDGSTSAATFTLDSATTPTSITRAT